MIIVDKNVLSFSIPWRDDTIWYDPEADGPLDNKNRNIRFNDLINSNLISLTEPIDFGFLVKESDNNEENIHFFLILHSIYNWYSVEKLDYTLVLQRS